MTTLRAQLRLADYFALAFGTMVGPDGFLMGIGSTQRAARRFWICSRWVLLLPVGYVYGQWVQRLPTLPAAA